MHLQDCMFSTVSEGAVATYTAGSGSEGVRQWGGVDDYQAGHGAGQTDVEAAQAGDLVGLAGHDVGRFQQNHVVELQALGQ